MGKRKPLRGAWTKNLGTMIAEGIKCAGGCDRCRGWKEVDLVKLAEIKGLDYSLWNRRTPCRLTPGCPGKVSFYCDGRFRMEPMHD